ncbi:MAG TPA: TetR/AcrR family transcriptional regulator [Propionibacteriaceae bacterium]|nr:TetR/AcrR family transcriptional regulator [Propionibacteriaceae bacterium]
MSEVVKGRRPYDASSRHQQARASRRRVLATATQMFVERGYSDTTVPAVARAAGVSPQNVYKAFRNKPGLLKAVFDVAMAGDDEPLAMIEREALIRVREEPDPREKLRLYGRFVADTTPRHTPIQLLARAAAATDPEAAAIWDELCAERLRGMTLFARSLAEHLRDDVTVDDARDLLWTHNSPELYDLLVNARGWSPKKFGQWLSSSLIAALLPQVLR